MSKPTVLNVAVCLFADAQLLDYGGPMDVLGFLNADNTFVKPPPSHLLRFTYIGPTEVIQPTAGPRALMDTTYEQLLNDGSKQFDVLFVPGGSGTTPRIVPPALLAFLKKQAPGAQYVLSVGTPCPVGRRREVLDGVGRHCWYGARSFGRETLNHPDSGLDMAFGWLGHLVGKDIAVQVAAVIEHAPRAQEDDDFAGVWTFEKQKALAEEVKDML